MTSWAEPEALPLDQLKVEVTVSLPLPPRMPPLSVRSATVLSAPGARVPPLTTSAPATESRWMVAVPDERVTVLPEPMTTSSPEPGTEPVLQFEPVPQLPVLPPTQVTVEAEV